MREIDYTKTINGLFTSNIVNYLTIIHEYKGRSVVHFQTKPDILDKLMVVAKIQSSQYSNKLEGISTSDKRLKEIIQEKNKA